MVSVHLQMPLANRRSWRRYLAQRVVELPAVPRLGEDVVISTGGWSEEVTGVWWDISMQIVSIKLGGRHTQSNCVEFDVDDEDGDLRETLSDAGWEIS